MRLIEIQVDLTEASRGLVHVVVDLPTQPGVTAKFTTPLYLCESHIGNGPVAYIGGVAFSAGGSTLRWTRDPFAPYVFLVDVPANVDSVRATFDAILPRYVIRRMSILNWESVLLHPWQRPVTEMFVEANVTMPSHWEYGTALVAAGQPTVLGNRKTVHFHPVTVERLADSPVLSGEFMSHVDVTVDKRHILHVATDRPTPIPAEITSKVNQLIQEATLVFGACNLELYHSVGWLTSLGI